MHRPSGHGASTPAAPVVFSFHGWGSSSSFNEGYMGLTATSDANGFFAVYPEGQLHRIATWRAFVRRYGTLLNEQYHLENVYMLTLYYVCWCGRPFRLVSISMPSVHAQLATCNPCQTFARSCLFCGSTVQLLWVDQLWCTRPLRLRPRHQQWMAVLQCCRLHRLAEEQRAGVHPVHLGLLLPVVRITVARVYVTAMRWLQCVDCNVLPAMR